MRHAETCIFSDGGTDLIVDLVGWFGPGGSPFQEFAPRRAVDTRQPSLRPPGVTGAPSVGQFVEIPRDMLGVPADAEAVVVNLTITQATGYGYLTAFPCGDDPPNTSNVNYNVGVDRANTSIMALGPQGSLCVRLSESSAHVIVDVNGWFGGTTGIHYAARTQRIADSRNGLGGWSGTFAPGETRDPQPGGLSARGESGRGARRRLDGFEHGRFHHRAAMRWAGRGLELELRRWGRHHELGRRAAR